MRNDEIAEAWEEAEAALQEHWQGSIDAGLEGITPENTAEAIALLDAYGKALAGLPEPATEAAILAEMERTIVALNDLNEREGGSLLETDEREMVCGFLIDAAVACGLDAEKFEDGDPTYAWREF